jgi:WD40 repeat protein
MTAHAPHSLLAPFHRLLADERRHRASDRELSPAPAVKLKAAWALLLTLVALAGAGSWVYRERAEEAASPPSAVSPSRPSTTAKDDPLPEGVLARLGSTRFRHSGHIWSLAISPDGKTVASKGGGEVVRFWDVKTGRQVRATSRQYRGIGPLTYSPDGATLAVWDGDANKPGISLLNTATANERRFVALSNEPPNFFGGLGAVAFSPDGKILASVKPSGEICLIDPVRGKVTAVLGKHDHANVPVLVFSPDGQTLASSGQDTTIRLWDVKRRKALFVLRSEDTNAFPVVFARDGKWLISGGGTQEAPNDWNSPWNNPAIRIWDVATGKQLRVFKDTEVRGTISSLALAPDGRTLAVSCKDKLRLWDLTTGKVLRSLPGSRSHNWPVYKLCFSPDGKLLVGGIGNMVGLWDTASGRLLNLDANESASDIACVALSGDGRLLAAGDHDNCLALWDFRSRRLIRRFRGHDTKVRRVAFSPDNKTLASISEYGRVRAWNVANGLQCYQFPVEATKDSRPTEVAFSPDGKLLAYAYFSDKQGGGPRGIRLLDAATGVERQNLTIKDAVHGWFDGIGFSPDGRHLVGITRDGEIQGWRREGDGFVKKGLLDRATPSRSAAFTHQGFLLVQMYPEKSVSFRDLDTGRPMRDVSKLPYLDRIPAISPDGRYLAAEALFYRDDGSQKPSDDTLRLYELASGQEVLRWRLPPHTSCNALTFAPDGRTLVAGMSDTTVLLWDLRPTEKGSAKDVSALWKDLADGDAAKAYRALSRMTAASAEALAYLRRRLTPVEGVDERRIERLIAELDSVEFAVREKAAERLRQLKELAEPALRKALASRPTLEMRRRLQDLLEDLARHPQRPSPELLRQLRAVEVLERIGTPEARTLLESLARGAAGARLSREARAAVQRLDSRRGDKR